MRAKLDYQKVLYLIEPKEEMVGLLQMASNLWTYTPRIAGNNFQELRKLYTTGHAFQTER